MASRDRVAGLDVGTSRVKLEVYDGGEIIARRELVNDFIIEGNKVEHDPKRLLHNVKRLIDEAKKLEAGCIGVATYRGSILAWKPPAEPLTNIVTWMDRRSLEKYGEIPLKARIASKLPVIGAMLSPESPMVKLRILSMENPRLDKALREGLIHAWNVDAYLLEGLTRSYLSDPSNKALMGVINPKSLEPVWAAARLLGLPKIPIPETLYHDEAIQVEGYSIGPFMGDQQAANHGLACLEKGCMRISMGSGVFASLTTGEPRLYSGRGIVPLILYRSRGSGVYGLEVYITGLGKAVEWFVDNLLGGDYGILDEAAGMPGRPPIVLPFFWGLRYPRIMRGVAGVIDIQPGHGLMDIARGVAHSVAASIAFLESLLERVAGRPGRIVLTGGLSRLHRLVRLVATYLGRSVERSLQTDAPARGAAILAARACGIDAPPPLDAEVVEPLGDVDLVEPRLLFDVAESIR